MELKLSIKNIIKIVIVILLIALSTGIYIARQKDNEILLSESQNSETAALETETNPDTESTMPKSSILVVDVAGEVVTPDVYLLNSDARVYEAIDAAGGLTDLADTRNTNLAAPLTDGVKLYIPSKTDVEKEQKITGVAPGSKFVNGSTSMESGQNNDTKNHLVNINTADSTQLQKLSGVGPSTADKIIAYRNEYGKFKRIENLMNVSGIGEKTFAKLKNSITVE